MDVTTLALTWVGWPNGEKLASAGVASRGKLWTCVHLRVRLARALWRRAIRMDSLPSLKWYMLTNGDSIFYVKTGICRSHTIRSDPTGVFRNILIIFQLVFSHYNLTLHLMVSMWPSVSHVCPKMFLLLFCLSLVLPRVVWFFHALKIFLSCDVDKLKTYYKVYSSWAVSELNKSFFFSKELQGTSWWSEFAYEKLLVGLAKEVTRVIQFYSLSFLVVPLTKSSSDWKFGHKEAVVQSGMHPGWKRVAGLRDTMS